VSDGPRRDQDGLDAPRYEPPDADTNARRYGWEPRSGLMRRVENETGSSEAAAPARPSEAARARLQARDPSGIFASPVAVAGDVILSGEGATSDLSERSAARLSGRAIAISGLLVVAGVVVARLLGWARTSVFGAEFGATTDLDAFWAAFRIPDLLFQLVAAGAVGSALVPVASGLLATGDEARARRLVATVANLMLLVLVPLAMLLFLLTPSLVAVFANNPDPKIVDLEIGMTRIMLLSPILLALGAVLAAGLNSVGVFGPPALAPNVYNVAILVAAIVLSPFFGIQALAIGVVIGAAGHVLTQVRATRAAGLWWLVLDYRDPAVAETLKLMAPRAIGLGVTQLVFFVNTYFAVAVKGDLSIYTFAFTALQIPVGLIGVPLGIVLLPPLSQAIARGDTVRFRTLVDQSLRMLLFVVVPLTGVMFALATPAMAVLYQHAKITADDIARISPVFLVFLVGLVAHVLISLLAPIFYAGKDTRTPVMAALLAVAVDVAAAATLYPAFRLEGLALAISLGAWAEVGMLAYFMERRIGFDLKPLAYHSAAFVAGGIVASAACLLAFQTADRFSGWSEAFLPRLIQLGVGGVVAVIVYVGWAWAFRLPELGDSIQLAKTLLRRSPAADQE